MPDRAYTETDLEPVYPLKEAVDRFLPGGHWTVSSLRTEIRKGRLQVERIAGKIGVTESAIREMRQLCRDKPKDPASTSGPPDTTGKQPGLSSTEERKQAQDAAKATLKALRTGSRNTSRKNTSHQSKVVSFEKS